VDRAAARNWAVEQDRPGTLQTGRRVESVVLRGGMSLIPSRFEPGEP